MSISPDHFALCFTEALKCPDIQNLLKDITRPTHEELRYMFSAELHRQLQPLKDTINQKDQKILELKKAVVDLRSELDQLEQHGRRDSLRFSGIPENPAHDNTDNKILDICNAIELDPPLQPTDIAVSHRLGKSVPGKTRQIIAKFSTRNIRERVFSARTKLKDYNNANPDKPNIYVNEDLTQFRANLAKEARYLKRAIRIADTWNIHGKIFVKDLHNHVAQINKSSDLDKY